MKENDGLKRSFHVSIDELSQVHQGLGFHHRAIRKKRMTEKLGFVHLTVIMNEKGSVYPNKRELQFMTLSFQLCVAPVSTHN